AVGFAEAEPVEEDDARLGGSDRFAHQVLTGHAEMDGALGELRRDLGGRQVGDLDALDARNGAAVVARAARLHEDEAGAGKECMRVLLQAALGRDGKDEWSVHAPASSAASRSIHTANPTAGIATALPSRISRPS